jgi:hypothetical protein
MISMGSMSVYRKKPKPSGRLTAAERRSLPLSDFVFPERRAYPIHDQAHANAALSQVSRWGTPEEKAKVFAAVAKRYPKKNKGLKK